jgi:E-phenylitaconyl-CoA hydratase
MAVHYTVENRIATVVLDHPEELNVLDIDDLQELRHVLLLARDDSEVRAIVLTGSGGDAFCTGASLLSRERPSGVDNRMYSALLDLRDLSIWKPMIAAINGACSGAGLELALQCDLRVSSDAATFAMPISGRVPAALRSIHALLRILPKAMAMEMLLIGSQISAESAHRFGLVNKVAALNDLASNCHVIAQQIVADRSLTRQLIKRIAVDRQTCLV